MNLKEIASKQIQDSIETKKAVLDTLLPGIEEAGKLASEVLKKGIQFYFVETAVLLVTLLISQRNSWYDTNPGTKEEHFLHWH